VYKKKDERKEAKDVAALLNNKTVAGKQLQVTVAKPAHERKSFVDRQARLKKLEQYSSVWPARNYKNVSSKDPKNNYNHVLAGKHGRPTRLGATKTIQKTKAVPSRALHLSGIPSNVNKKQILEALKEYGPTRGRFSHNGKKASYGFVFFKTPEARAKAQAALKAKKGLTIGDATIKTAYANRYGKQNVHERRPKAAAPKAAATKKAAPAKGTKTTATKKAAPAKGTKTTATKKAAAKPKANSGKARKTKTPSTAAPAIVEQPKILGKTKSGRVTKTTAPPPTKAPAKKRAAKK